METIKAIFARRSVREFKQKEVSYEVVSLLASSALVCPKPGGFDIVDIIAIQDPELKEQLFEISDKQQAFLQAPVIFAVVVDVKKCEDYFWDQGKAYAIQTGAMAAENLMIAATSLGLGSVYIAHFEQEEASSLLNIPEGKMIVAFVPVGYPTKELKERELPNLIGKLWFDKFGNRLKDPEKFEHNYREFVSKFFKKQKLKFMNFLQNLKKKKEEKEEKPLP